MSKRVGDKGVGDERKRGRRGDGLKGKEVGRMRDRGWEERGQKA